MKAMNPKAKTGGTKLVASLGEDHSYDRTSSPDGTLETMIFMHSRMGIRIEFNIHRSTLALWISPQAGKSVGYRNRNFSNRDDHTCIFDRIEFPELGAKGFVACDYDPFHSVLRYKNQKVHIASLLDKPAVLVWTEKEEVVDFKGDKQDAINKRTAAFFSLRHPDRGYEFDFCAALGKGAGAFLHQPEVDVGRSTYARAVVSAGQLLVIGGELMKEKVAAMVARVASRPVAALLRENESLIARELLPGTVAIRNHREMQKLYDMNKRHLLSAQDASGAIHAALKYVYYLIWSTDGSVTSTHMVQTGWHEFHMRWVKFILSNPTSQEHGPKGRFYGQLVNGKITKREEFGSLCAVWAAYMHWGLTGDKKFVSGKYLPVLEGAVAWLDRYCWDAKVGGVGTYYTGGGSEDPFFGSNDFGWDAAVGSPMSRTLYAPRHEGRIIKRVYEFNMNLNHFNMYLMLASVTTGAKSASYLKKAAVVERFLYRLLNADIKAYYLLEGKGMVPVRYRPGENETGLLAVQSRSPAFFMPDFARLYLNRQKAFVPLTRESVRGEMPCYVYGMLAGLDTEFVDEGAVFSSVGSTVGYHAHGSQFMPMPYTMVETLGAKEGEYHDIRPQAFSAGPFQAAVTNLAVRTMPFGIALRGTNHLAQVLHFDYLDGYLDIKYSGTGAVGSIRLNGRMLEHTLQIPDSRMKKGANAVAIALVKVPGRSPVLVYSTVRLHDVSAAGGSVRYRVTGYCQNVLIFRDVTRSVTVRDDGGRDVIAVQKTHGRHLFVEFSGKGSFSVEVVAE